MPVARSPLPPPPGLSPAGLDDISAMLLPRESARATRRCGWQRHALRRSDLLLAMALFVAALLVRWPFIARGETMLHSDEAIVGIMAQDIAEGMRWPIYFYGQRYMGALEAYVIAALRPLFADPIVSLRLGPAFFFAALVAVQYVMLSRWFGRRGGWVGALTLLAASPMFLQWSISARGGYIEILLWGSLVWWAYSEWFVRPIPATRRGARKAALGFLIGSGMWINPAIVLFVVPVVVHALLGRPLEVARESRITGAVLRWLDKTFMTLPLALPVAALAGVLLLNCMWAVWVDEGDVHHLILLGRPAALLGAMCALLLGVGTLRGIHCDRRPLQNQWMALRWKRTRLVQGLREYMDRNAIFMVAMVVGLTPALIYVAPHALSGQQVEPSVPLGIRPIWTAADNVLYFLKGLPLLLGADARPFMDLVCIGREYPDTHLPALAAAGIGAANWVVLGGLIVVALQFVRRYRAELGGCFRLRAGPHSPAVFLVLALSIVVGLYLLSGCAIDFNSIRYLVPIWAVLPGIIAAVAGRSAIAPNAVAVNPTGLATRCRAAIGVCAVLASWGLGQVAYLAQIGPEHPLHAVARELVARRERATTAELFDAHILSFLTQQKCHVSEYRPFWARLGHYRAGRDKNGSTSYLVRTSQHDWMRDWVATGFPGPPPPECVRALEVALYRERITNPEVVRSRDAVGPGYALWRLDRVLPGDEIAPSPAVMNARPWRPDA